MASTGRCNNGQCTRRASTPGPVHTGLLLAAPGFPSIQGAQGEIVPIDLRAAPDLQAVLRSELGLPTVVNSRDLQAKWGTPIVLLRQAANTDGTHLYGAIVGTVLGNKSYLTWQSSPIVVVGSVPIAAYFAATNAIQMAAALQQNFVKQRIARNPVFPSTGNDASMRHEMFMQRRAQRSAGKPK